MNRSVWLFPGQGGQSLEMLKGISDSTFSLIQSITGIDYRTIKPNFSSTIDLQLLIFALEADSADALLKMGMQPSMVAGHSLGAFGAAYCARVLSLEESIRLVYERAQLMESLFPQHYGMGVQSIFPTIMRIYNTHSLANYLQLMRFLKSLKNRGRDYH